MLIIIKIEKMNDQMLCKFNRFYRKTSFIDQRAKQGYDELFNDYRQLKDMHKKAEQLYSFLQNPENIN